MIDPFLEGIKNGKRKANGFAGMLFNINKLYFNAIFFEIQKYISKVLIELSNTYFYLTTICHSFSICINALENSILQMILFVFQAKNTFYQRII